MYFKWMHTSVHKVQVVLLFLCCCFFQIKCLSIHSLYTSDILFRLIRTLLNNWFSLYLGVRINCSRLCSETLYQTIKTVKVWGTQRDGTPMKLTKIFVGVFLYWHIWFTHMHYRKFPKYSDTQQICCNYPKSWTRWLFLRVMHPKYAKGIANREDPDQTAPLGAVWSGTALFAQACPSENLGK